MYNVSLAGFRPMINPTDITPGNNYKIINANYKSYTIISFTVKYPIINLFTLLEECFA